VATPDQGHRLNDAPEPRAMHQRRREAIRASRAVPYPIALCSPGVDPSAIPAERFADLARS